MDVLNSYFYLDESNYSLFQTYHKNQGKKADRKANQIVGAKYLV